ncbi:MULTISPECIES: ABC transporter substrate-binding protein [unclassified Salinivibrio]|uniref:ABC transporter substrate-binding protein n=1 Tax=unclassified Salinivibrio TaxID=2636825 RepID=UPI001F51D3AA|nr:MULTISPECIES: ABC transporter substrate-binding protein [unclassified Salinivibrio]
MARLNRYLSHWIISGMFATYSLAVSASDVEVLHWWTSAGEAKAASVLREGIEQRGHQWQDFAVGGRAGISAMNTLRIRAISGNPPLAAQIKGPEITEWARLGFLRNLNEIAEAEHWEDKIPAPLRDVMQYQGNYVAAPINIHRVNWLWINLRAFEAADADVPTDFDSFFTAADKLKQAGYIPLALGGEPWQVATLFDSLALSVLGPQDYQRAFLDFDRKALLSDDVVKAFTLLAKMRQYVDDSGQGRNWSDTTRLLIDNQAGMQVMGDWAKGEFFAANQQEGNAFTCVAFPGTKKAFSYNVDSFVFFKPNNQSERQSQTDMASYLLTPQFQRDFNRYKGSLPIRFDVPLPQGDRCAQQSRDAFIYAQENGTLSPSMSHGLSTTRYVQSAVFDVINEFFYNPEQTPREATEALYRAILSAQA